MDWDRFLDLCSWHRISGLVYQALRVPARSDTVPAEVLAKLDRRYERAVVTARDLDGELGRVMKALGEAEVQVVLLKGAALVQTVYDDPALRPMGDLDLLIPEDQLDLAERIVRGLGYDFFDGPEVQATAREKHRHYPRLSKVEGDCAIELHRHIVETDSPLHFEVAALWETAREASLGPTRTMVLGAEEQLIHLCLNFFLDRRLSLPELLRPRPTCRHCPGCRQLPWRSRLGSSSREPPAESLRWAGRLFTVVGKEAAQSRHSQRDPRNRLDDGRFSPETVDLFVDRKVLERRPWFFHELVTPEENASGKRRAQCPAASLLPAGVPEAEVRQSRGPSRVASTICSATVWTCC